MPNISLSSRTMTQLLVFSFITSSLGLFSQAGDFEIKIVRDPKSVEVRKGKDKDGNEVTGSRIMGKITVNNSDLGTTYENDDKKIPAGKYSGTIRTRSKNGHCLNAEGTLGDEGDFLLEIIVEGRTDILIHGGTEPWHSEGCVMLGAVKDPKGKRIAPEPLKQLRQLYFEAKGKDPELKLVISVD